MIRFRVFFFVGRSLSFMPLNLSAFRSDGFFFAASSAFGTVALPYAIATGDGGALVAR